jgi:hypothetical protein
MYVRIRELTTQNEFKKVNGRGIRLNDNHRWEVTVSFETEEEAVDFALELAEKHE